MKIFVKVKPKAKKEKLERISQNQFSVSLKEPAIQGRANRALLRILREHFKIKAGGIRIISGPKARNKIIEVPDSAEGVGRREKQ